MSGQSYADWKSWRAEEFGTFTPLQAAYFRDEFANAGVDLSVARDVLEIGFGNGSALGWMRSLGHRVCGVEILQESLERARAAGTRCYDRIDLIPQDQAFDLIVAFDVFEHLSRPELEQALAQLGARLKAGGHIVARFPNCESPLGMAYQNGDVTHVSALGERIMSQLAVTSGLRISGCGEPRTPLRGVGLPRMIKRAAVLAVRRLCEYALRQIYFDGEKLRLSPNLVVVLTREPATS